MEPSFTLSLFNKSFLPFEGDDSWCARPSSNLLAALHRCSADGTARWIASIQGHKIALGEPVFESKNWSRTLYLPEWFCFQVGIQGTGDRVQVDFLPAEVLEKATALHFQSVGESLPHGLDVRDFLEAPLSSLGVLKEGMLLPVEALGIHLLVKKVEPGGEAFLDGNEIAFYMDEKEEEVKDDGKENVKENVKEGGGMLGNVLSSSQPSLSQISNSQPTGRGCQGSRLLKK